MNRLLTISEAARQLGCSVEWLRMAEPRGKIPRARRDMNAWRRYSLEDIEALREVMFPTSNGWRPKGGDE